nr:DNA polymerase I [Pseudomonadota bacterium]
MSEPHQIPPDALYLIDGSGFIFRAFHALPMLTRPDGTPVNAVLGFTNMLMKLLGDLHASRVAVIFDAARKNWRNDVYPDYKAHRPPPPPELVPQFSLIREATEAFSLPAIEQEGFEADDLIATYARQARDRGMQVMIVSSDKDLMQLIGPGISLLDPIRYKPIGPAEVLEKFGVPPEKVTDVQALAGDSTDNVPGVPGIGVKTAAQLINEYGSLDNLLANAGNIPQPRRRELLQTHADQARISLRLVRLDDQSPLPVPVDSLEVHRLDRARLRAFLEKQGFRSILSRLDKIAPNGGPDEPLPSETLADPLPPPVQEAPEKTGPVTRHYQLVQDVMALKKWIDKATEQGFVAVDTETDSLEAVTARLVGVSLATAAGHACYIPVGHIAPNAQQAVPGMLALEEEPEKPPQIPLDQAIALLKPMLEDPSVLKIGQNLKYDMQVLDRYGIRLSPWDDTMLLSYVLDAGLHGHGMDELAKIHCGETPITYKDVTGTGKSQVTFDRVPLDRALAYSAEDADITLRLHTALKPRLVMDRMTAVYETIERPLVRVIADMERTGVKVDRQALAHLGQDFGQRMQVIEADLHRLAGQSFNPASPKQLGEILFDRMGLPGGVKTRTGMWSTDSEVLEPLAEQGVEIASRILDWRQLAKLKNTYADALHEQINPQTGRVHTSFSMAATTTGRLAATNPNLQNIPIRTEEGRKIRQAFIAEPGHVLV